jgi:tetratricopeptide (TPR) repeat protein
MYLLKRHIVRMLIMAVLAGFLLPASASAAECRNWVARAVSVQGMVQYRASDGKEWNTVHSDKTFCEGDMVRVQEKSRAAVLLSNKTVIRLDQNTTLTFSGIDSKKISLIEIIKGIVHFISRTPMTLKVSTPFVNGTVEGTEFLVKVSNDQSMFLVLEGRVATENQQGKLVLASGEAAIASEGKPPVLRVDLRPLDAVQWALYYPLIVEHPDEISTELLSLVNSSAKLLSVGRVDEAEIDIEKALKISPSNSSALALRSVIYVVKNEKGEALAVAQKAVDTDPASAAARIAFSYAQQAGFDLTGALMTLEKAAEVAPQNSIAWARLSEIQFSLGDTDKALKSAEKAAALNPGLSRAQTVLGFIRLAQINTPQAVDAFNEAIILDQADPLPRLGLGLAKIRNGRLEDGREDIEIAASLDPGNSLIRSYLGKAYYEEKRDKIASDQFDMAKRLDPLDPTPFFYNAIFSQSKNMPVAALNDLQKSVELNDNRAIYRSKLFLDEDLAARSASLARIYSDLGFQQLALVEGWKSLSIDPANYSAHRFLADLYSALPRHEIARVSELLQSQLLQPLNLTPVQPRLAESGLFLLSEAGPGTLSFNEFNPLFNRNRIGLLLSGIAGGHSTFGDEAVVSGILDNFSFSVGQFHHATDGFRENNDQSQDIYNAYVQLNPSRKTSFLAELRYREGEEGDLPLRFDKDEEENFFPNLRKENKSRIFRVGLRHSPTQYSDIIAHWTLTEAEESFHNETAMVTDIAFKDEGYMAEAQYLFRSDMVNLTGGIGYFSADSKESILVSLVEPPIPLVDSYAEPDISHTNLYLYSNIHLPKELMLTLGASYDLYDDDTVHKDQLNPKVGLTWIPFPGTTFRAAGFRTLKRAFVSDQTIEPTHVAGFNQFFDDDNGTDVRRYGVAVDQKVSETAYGGFEYSKRELDRPVIDTTDEIHIDESRWDEKVARAYIYWTPKPWAALSAEYLFERFKRDPDETGEEEILSVDTHRIPLVIRIFCPSGLNAQFSASYVNQDGEFGTPGEIYHGDDEFWVFDASAGYRLPKRFGVITVGVKNLFDKKFQFQDTDLANQTIYPERLIFGKFTASF